LNTKVGNATAECVGCIDAKQQEALEEFRLNPNLECGALNDNICRPVSECSCVEPCDNEISEMYHCQIQAAFASDATTADLISNCTISCTGTNTTVDTPEDDFTENDDFVGGLCAGEEAAVKLCLESFGTTLEQCDSCITQTGVLDVLNSTTCSDLQENTCRHIASCSCVQECEEAFIDMGNCDVEYAQVTYTQLQGCVQSGDSCQLDNGGNSGTGGTGGSSTAGSSTAASSSVSTKEPRNVATFGALVVGGAFSIIASLMLY
jgi:hypothetical protein